jgi:hypothetical protein
MTGQRLLCLSAGLSLATACVPQVNSSLAPQRGPEARIRASFTGGITNRRAQARFTVEDDAYVMVGHLGGDGYVRILFPSSPFDRDAVTKGKTYTTNDVYAASDAIPALYQARTVRYRHLSARLDSYDGGGNGFFFIIASRHPLHFDEISAGGLFDVIEVPNYYDTYDPRLTIKALGDLVTRGSPYTLDFANSFSTVDYSSPFEQQWDCLTLSMFSFGFSGYAYTPYYPFGSRSFRNTLACASQYAALPYRNYRTLYGFANTPVTTITPTPRTDEPRGTIRPPWQRRVTPPRRSATRSAANAYLPDNVNARRVVTRASERLAERNRARAMHDRARRSGSDGRPGGRSANASSGSRATSAASDGRSAAASRESGSAGTSRAQPSSEGRASSSGGQRKRDP